jgi:hypothetical protein
MVLIAPIITVLTKELITIKHNLPDRDDGQYTSALNQILRK